MYRKLVWPDLHCNPKKDLIFINVQLPFLRTGYRSTNYLLQRGLLWHRQASSIPPPQNSRRGPLFGGEIWMSFHPCGCLIILTWIQISNVLSTLDLITSCFAMVRDVASLSVKYSNCPVAFPSCYTLWLGCYYCWKSAFCMCLPFFAIYLEEELVFSSLMSWTPSRIKFIPGILREKMKAEFCVSLLTLKCPKHLHNQTVAMYPSEHVKAMTLLWVFSLQAPACCAIIYRHVILNLFAGAGST